MNINSGQQKLFSLCLVLSLVIFCSETPRSSIKKFRFYTADYENVLGTSLQIKVSAASEDEAVEAENTAIIEIDRLDHILSGYNKQSEFSRWMNGPKKPTRVSPELFKVLGLFSDWRTRTNGALDASAEVIGRLWKDAAKQNKIPAPADISGAVNQVKQNHYQLDPTGQTAQRLDNAPLMLNSFAKSYIIEKACDAALASGKINAVVLNIGGDIVMRGTHTEQVQISDPKADAENDAPISTIKIRDRAIATSGNYRRGELINGTWYSHIVDPRSGFPASQVISSTVVTAHATDAGALATAFSILTPAESALLAAKVPGTEYLIITRDGQRLESKGWKGMEISSLTPPITDQSHASSLAQTWDPNYELLINLQLAEIEGFRVHRPYVAIWVTDQNKKPVRNIALWYNKTRYLDELHAWYDTYYDQFSNSGNQASSTSGATRSPGNYKLKWDGKDDNGKLVNKGIYFIYIEVAREHGTYQLINQQMDFSGAPKQITLKGNTEIAAASLDYRKKL
jgi:thiamine biosynthesis lipoprotein